MDALMSDDELVMPPALEPYEVDFAANLRRWRSDYTDRRTVPWQLLREAESLVNQGVAEAAAFYAGQLVEVGRRAAMVDELMKERDVLLAELENGRTIYQSTKAADTEGLVSITVARGISGWTIADLEEAAYRLRCGGGEDDTPVDIDVHSAKAVVPAPNLIPLHTRRESPLLRPDLDIVDRNDSHWLGLWSALARIFDVMSRPAFWAALVVGVVMTIAILGLTVA